MNYVVIENEKFCLKLSENCIAESLVYKPTGEECLKLNEEIAFFSLTEDRPFNNEIKLAYPNKRTTFNANRVRREGNKLIIGFELITFEAVVEIKEAPDYIAFTLADFIIKPEDFGHLAMTPPPVAEFRLVQLPISDRERFGQWLNVSWDDRLAVNVLATSPHARIDSEKRKSCRIMTADAVRGIKLKGCTAALIVSPSDKFLDVVETIETDYNLPSGVKSRRSEHMNSSTYWVGDITPLNVDEHIAYAKRAGLKMMLIYYTALYKSDFYRYCGDYDFRDEYPNGIDDLKKMLQKIKDAGLMPGIHFLHPHIGIKSRYVTPVADHRLNLTRHFTLAKPLGTDDDIIYVEQNPEGAVMEERCRVLKFDGELIYYESYSTEYPYCFKGCKRGHFDTNITPHSLGTIGGILDLSEYAAISVYIDQNTSLQDEVAQKLADAYNAGFEFIYFDGSEGTNPPFEFHIPNAQYKVYKKLNTEPVYCEGAAKAHFSWHMITGGNAFDTFKTEVFKEKIVQFPFDEAPMMANNFTRLNFGWWGYFEDTQPDIYEFGTSRAAAWDCPVTMLSEIERFKTVARTDDTLEVLRRWEDVRAKNWLTDKQKEELKNPGQEHILIINENQEYELLPYNQIANAANGNESVSAFIFERNGKACVVCWHKTGSGKLSLPISASDVTYLDEIGGNKISFDDNGSSVTIPIEGRRYLVSNLGKEQLKEAFEKAQLID